MRLLSRLTPAAAKTVLLMRRQSHQYTIVRQSNVVLQNVSQLLLRDIAVRRVNVFWRL